MQAVIERLDEVIFRAEVMIGEPDRYLGPARHIADLELAVAFD